jgi:hypothetical protein
MPPDNPPAGPHEGQRHVNVERMGMGVVGGTAHVASGLVRGVGEVGRDVVEVVRDTATVAIDGVGTIGHSAIHTIAGLMGDVVGIVRGYPADAGRADRDRHA